MPLHEPPAQKCGSRHWLTEPCLRGVCALLTFERDIPVYVDPSTGPDKSVEVTMEAGEVVSIKGRPRKEVGETAIAEGTRKSALSAAEKQKRYRERQKLKKENT